MTRISKGILLIIGPWIGLIFIVIMVFVIIPIFGNSDITKILTLYLSVLWNLCFWIGIPMGTIAGIVYLVKKAPPSPTSESPPSNRAPNATNRPPSR